MHNLIYLLLRRMRVPLIVVILAYAISILGMVLAPGVDDQGNLVVAKRLPIVPEPS